MNNHSENNFFLLYLGDNEANSKDMERKYLQREQIVLHPEKRDGRHCIRIDYAGSRRIAELLVWDSFVQTDSTGSAHVDAEGFSLPDFYDRYSPHAYIDYSRVYVRHPKPKREYTLPEGYLELLERKRYSPSTIKTYRAYFSDFMEYHKDRNINRLKVADIKTTSIYLHVTSAHKSSIPNPLDSLDDS